MGTSTTTTTTTTTTTSTSSSSRSEKKKPAYRKKPHKNKAKEPKNGPNGEKKEKIVSQNAAKSTGMFYISEKVASFLASYF
jgi:hypothetical protein